MKKNNEDLYLPNDPNKNVSLRELVAKHGGFTNVVEKNDWFDEKAKPRKRKNESDFEPDPNLEDD